MVPWAMRLVAGKISYRPNTQVTYILFCFQDQLPAHVCSVPIGLDGCFGDLSPTGPVAL